MTSRPSEQDVRDYVLHHQLSRPRVPWLRLSLAVAAFEGALLGVVATAGLKAGQALLLADACHAAVVALWGRQLLSAAVKIYQRYAPEHLRRACKCMPTCSEYALMALEKYVWPKALVLIVKRVMHTCDLPGYKTDYP